LVISQQGWALMPMEPRLEEVPPVAAMIKLWNSAALPVGTKILNPELLLMAQQLKERPAKGPPDAP
jgi:hypothetical protein